ncbi:MAG: phenylalanine--tRNA ligase subunit alpha, partial [Candidatus Kapaibacterium sp.]
MIENIKRVHEEVKNKINEVTNLEQLEAFRLEFLIKKGKIQEFFGQLKELPNDQKREVGKELNILSKYTEGIYKTTKEELEEKALTTSDLDLSLPGIKNNLGSEHPV